MPTELKETGRDEKLPVLGKEPKQEVVTITAEKLDEMQVSGVNNIGALSAIKTLEGKVEELTDEHEAYFLRLGIEDMRSLLNNTIKTLDQRLIEIMREKGIKEFESGFEERKVVIYLGQEKEKKMTQKGRDKMRRFIKPESSEPKCQMAFDALSEAEAIWSKSKIKLMADTMGYDINDFITVKWKDKIKVSYVPKWVLEK